MLIVAEGNAFRRGAARRTAGQFGNQHLSGLHERVRGIAQTDLKGQSVDGLLRRRCGCLLPGGNGPGKQVSPESSLELP